MVGTPSNPLGECRPSTCDIVFRRGSLNGVKTSCFQLTGQQIFFNPSIRRAEAYYRSDETEYTFDAALSDLLTADFDDAFSELKHCNTVADTILLK